MARGSGLVASGELTLCSGLRLARVKYMMAPFLALGAVKGAFMYWGGREGGLHAPS
jgi:hypothetical protein